MATSLVDSADAFLSSLRAKSPRTRATYATGVRRFLGWLDESAAGAAPLSTERLDEGVLEAFYLSLVDEFGRERQATVTTYTAAARAFMRYAMRQGQITGVSMERAAERLRAVQTKAFYRTPRIDNGLALIVDYVKSELPQVLTDEEDPLARLRAMRDAAVLQVLFCTGMRRAEVARLDRRDLDEGHAAQALVTGKGGRERVIFFDEDTRHGVRRYLSQRRDAYAPLFIRHRGAARNPGRAGERLRLSPQSIWKIVKRYAELAGVPASTHDFRHFKATSLLNRGANLSEVQDILGHASPETTKRIYAHYETEKLREVFDRFSVPVEEAALAARRRAAGA